jgi:hypothetical protein
MKKIVMLLLFFAVSMFVAVPCADAATQKFGGHIKDIKIDAEDEEWDLENFFIRLDQITDASYGNKEFSLLIETRGRYPGADCEREDRNLHTCGSSPQSAIPQYTLEILYDDEVEETLTEFNQHGCKDPPQHFNNAGFTCDLRKTFDENKFANTKVVITRRGEDWPLGPADDTWRYVDWKSLELPLNRCITKKTGDADTDGELACKAIDFCKTAFDDCIRLGGGDIWQFRYSQSSPELSLTDLEFDIFFPWAHLEYRLTTPFDWTSTSMPNRFYMQTRDALTNFAKHGKILCEINIQESILECRIKLRVRKERVKGRHMDDMEMKAIAMGEDMIWFAKVMNLTDCKDLRKKKKGIDVCKQIPIQIAPVGFEVQIPDVPTVDTEDEQPETLEQSPTLNILKPAPSKSR